MMVRAVRARVLLRYRHTPEAQREFEEWARLRPVMKDLYVNLSSGVAELDDSLLAFADDELLQELLAELNSDIGVHARSQSHGFCLDHLRGDIARRLGRLDEAREHYETGVKWARRERAVIEEGRCLQGFAELAAGSHDYATAIAHLDRAAAVFGEHGVKFHLDQVIARKMQLLGISNADPNVSILAVSNALQAERPDLSLAASRDGSVTIMFSDIEGSTALNERLGDTRWMELLRAHNAILDREVQAHGGRTVKTIGDGYMVAFAAPEAGVQCALAIQRALSESPLSHDEGPGEGQGVRVRVRIGLHTGRMVQQGDDFFGREVNYAARVANAALGGEILVSTLVKERLGFSFTLDAGREVEMKGFDGAQRVFGVSG